MKNVIWAVTCAVFMPALSTAHADTAIGAGLLPVPTMVHVETTIGERGSAGLGFGSGDSGSAYDLFYKYSFAKPMSSGYFKIGASRLSLTNFLGFISASGDAVYAGLGKDWAPGSSVYLSLEMGYLYGVDTGNGGVYPNFRLMYRFR